MADLQLSPLVSFVEDRRAEPVRHGVAHRLSGESLGLSPDLTGLLQQLQEVAIAPDELPPSHELRETFDLLERLHFLVPSTDPESLLRPFLGHRLVRPWMNPAVSFRGDDGRTWLVRLERTDLCVLPRSPVPPAVTEEPVPEPAATLLRLAETGSRTLAEAVESAGIAEVWNGLDFLTHPERQAIRLIPPATGLGDTGRPTHWLQQSFEWGDPDQAPAPDLAVDTARPFYQADIGEASWNFDWVEPTISHAFRHPTAALDGQAYGERLCEVLLGRMPERHPGAALRVLEVGGGVGFFARAFLGRLKALLGGSSGLEYTILDCSPVLQEKQKATLRELGHPVRFVLGNAEELSFPGERFDLIVSNEVIADLTVSRGEPGTGEGWVHSGIYAFLDGIAAHLAPGGLACVTEYGELDAPPQLVEHLNHPEYSIHFGPLMAHAEGLGLAASLHDLGPFLGVRPETEMLCGQQERILCLNHLLARYGQVVPYAAFCRPGFQARFGELVSRLEIGGLAFAPVASGLHFGPAFPPFRALLLKQLVSL